jgi:hypothetical protein
MHTAATTHSLRIRLAIVATLAFLSTGCAGVGQRIENWYYGHSIRAQQHHELADVRQDTRVALAEQEQEALRLAAEREVEQARVAAERARLEMEFCAANQEQLREQLRSNIREEVESKVAFNVRQGLEVGELVVNEEKLREMLKEREQPPPGPPRAPVREKCKCCDAPCGCEPGLLRRHCPRCRNKPCEAEKDCGGPEALALLERQPFRQPLRPAEIPLMLPVRLTFGMQQPEVEGARVRRQPIIEQPPPRDQFREGPCPVPCTDPANLYQKGLPSAQPTMPTVPAQVENESIPPADPPQPVADPSNEARWRIQPPHGFKLGVLPANATIRPR